MPDERQYPPPNQLTDLNLLALAEFRALVAKEKDLPQEWKTAVVGLADDAIPGDLSFLNEVMGDKLNDNA